MRYSISGTTEPPRDKHDSICRVLAGLEDGTEFTTGGAEGVDTISALFLRFAFPSAKHRVILPDGVHHHPLWMRDGPMNIGFEIVTAHAPASYNTSQRYMLRNDRLVDHADVLVAFPLTAHAVMRGKGAGTWATIRRARSRKIPVKEHPLS